MTFRQILCNGEKWASYTAGKIFCTVVDAIHVLHRLRVEFFECFTAFLNAVKRQQCSNNSNKSVELCTGAPRSFFTVTPNSLKLIWPIYMIWMVQNNKISWKNCFLQKVLYLVYNIQFEAQHAIKTRWDKIIWKKFLQKKQTCKLFPWSKWSAIETDL